MGRLRILFFASARQAAGCDEATIACEADGIGEATFWERLLADFPALAPLRDSVGWQGISNTLRWESFFALRMRPH